MVRGEIYQGALPPDGTGAIHSERVDRLSPPASEARPARGGPLLASEMVRGYGRGMREMAGDPAAIMTSAS